MNVKGIEATALSIRSLSMDAIQKANSGHPGTPMGAAEVAAVLYGEVMKHNPLDSKWVDRDRFVLSAGHGSMLLYSILHIAGYKVSMDDIKSFRQVGSKCPGHPEYGITDGVEATSGPLGQGIALCFLNNPIDMHAPDNRKVYVMFILLSATTQFHLEVLSELAVLFRNTEFRSLLETKPTEKDLLIAIKQAGF